MCLLLKTWDSTLAIKLTLFKIQYENEIFVIEIAVTMLKYFEIIFSNWQTTMKIWDGGVNCYGPSLIYSSVKNMLCWLNCVPASSKLMEKAKSQVLRHGSNRLSKKLEVRWDWTGKKFCDFGFGVFWFCVYNEVAVCFVFLNYIQYAENVFYVIDDVIVLYSSKLAVSKRRVFNCGILVLHQSF